jgi:hypothetical protein
MPVPPQEYAPSLFHSPSAAPLPFSGSQQQARIRNSQSSVAGAGLSLGENHFPTNSLTWRELLTGLTTCLFNHGPETRFFNHFRLSSSKVRVTTTTTGKTVMNTQNGNSQTLRHSKAQAVTGCVGLLRKETQDGFTVSVFRDA